MNISKEDVKDTFRLLRERPSMMLTGDINSLDTYISYFEGFGDCYYMFKGINWTSKISLWYYKKYETKKYSLLWSAHFSKKHENLPEKEKIVLFLDRIEEFIYSDLLDQES